MAQLRKLKLANWKRIFFALFCSAALTEIVWPAQSAYAQNKSSSEFAVSPALRGAVDFWIQVFTKYGKYQLIFHHRDDPAIIYSILDFEDLSKTQSGRSFEKLREEEIDRETERIQAELHQLAAGTPATTAWAKRISRLFDRFGVGDKLARYKEAASIEKLRTQSGVKEMFREGLRRSGQYLPAIEAIFSEQGLPPELGRVPFIESSFNYDAYSSVGAAGIWQFMRSTARNYMRVGYAIDERRDPIISTRAAAKYLSRAREVLGAWSLAITSYNHGINGVLKASKTVGSTDIAKLIREYDGKSWGFASKNFFVEYLAALEVERNYKRYFPDLILDKTVYFDEVQLGKATSYGDLISASTLDAGEFEHLNPALRSSYFKLKSMVPAGAFVKVPYGKAVKIMQIARGSAVTWQFSPTGGKRVSEGFPMRALEAERKVKKAVVVRKSGLGVKVKKVKPVKKYKAAGKIKKATIIKGKKKR